MSNNYNSIPNPFPKGTSLKHRPNSYRADPYRQYNPNLFERLLFLIVAIELIFYFIWMIVIPIITWILANPGTFIVITGIIFGFLYIAGYTIKKVVDAVGNGIIRLIREFKQ